MGNTISVVGTVCSGLKRYNNDDGSIKILFTVASRTNDPARWKEQTGKDFWNVDLYIPQSRAKLVEALVEKRLVSIGGIPYKRYDENKREFTSIRGIIDMVSFHNANPEKSSDGENSNNRSDQPNSGTDSNQPKQGW